MERSDEELLRGAQTGDRDALEALLTRYQPQVYRFGMRMCHNPEDAKDILQDTLLAVARNVGDFRSRASISTWLYAIARSFCVKKRRRGRSVKTLQIDDGDQDPSRQVADPGPGPEEQAERHELEAILTRAIAGLAPIYREVFVLRDVEGLNATEVAEVLGISVDTVKSRLHRARLAVRDTLAPSLDLPPAAPATDHCPNALLMFSRHLEGEISTAVCARMERHVDHCAHCRHACSSLQRTLHLCRTSPAPQVPESVQEAVRQQVRTLVAKNS